MRGPSRTAYADPEVALSSDGTTVLSAGDSRLELWRSDMVRMIGYGTLDARIKPGNPGPVLCRLGSAAASSAAVSVLEACPDQPDLRLTLLRPAKEEDTPDLKYVPLHEVKENSGARVVAVSETTTAVYVPTPRPSVMVIDETGATTANLPLPKPASPEAAATRPGDLITWWTGDAVMVFAASGMQYRYTDRPGRHTRSDRPGDDDGRAADHPGQRRRRRLRPDDGSQRTLHPVAPPARAVGGGARRRRPDPARAARRHAGRVWAL